MSRQMQGPTIPAPIVVLAQLFVFAFVGTSGAPAMEADWRREFPKTDFSRHTVDLSEIISSGPGRDGIPAIQMPLFVPGSQVDALAPTEPVIGLVINGDARAYPLRILMRHEIVNDVVGKTAVAVTYCPLCNTAIAFQRVLDGRLLHFGTTGRLRHSDLVMYDAQTESWWQQFSGEGIVGEYAGIQLDLIPVRLESWQSFRFRFPDGRVLLPPGGSWQTYENNPYVRYDTARSPSFYRGKMPAGLPPMARVVVVGNEAWSLELLRKRGRIETQEIILTWTPGQNSALDKRKIVKGRDVGNVVVQRKADQGVEDAVHVLTFAFAFHAFHPEGRWHLE